MDGITLLQQAAAAGLTVQAEGERLRIRGPKRAELVARRLIEHKSAVLAALGGDGDKTPTGEPESAVVSPSPVSPAAYEVAEGWTRAGWIRRLRYLAGICVHQGRAAELREWADGLKSEAG